MSRRSLDTIRLLPWAFLASVAVGTAASAQPAAADSPTQRAADTHSCASGDREPLQLTPLVMQTVHSPTPFKGGDGRYHLVYELTLENFSGDRVRADALQVLDARHGASLASLEAATIASRLVVRDRQAVAGEFAASQLGILYLHVVVDQQSEIPPAIEHRLTMTSTSRTVSATAACTSVTRPTELLLDAPLRGKRFIAGDGCCDSTRHVRATLPLNGTAYDAQRFAIDWEQLDAHDRIYVGDPKQPASYVIYGKPAYAVADARVIAAVDGMADSPIGSLPNVPPDKADGNHVILALGQGRYALYAHFKPHSLRVSEGQNVRRGQLLALVGTSGNSSEPHLHFQLTDGPSALMSNGVPYLLREFNATRRGASTAAFDKAIIDGQPLETVPLVGPAEHEQELPLDLWISDLPE
jgi:peptidase M23-like protein